MKLWQAFRLALKSILGSKMRSFLTMLGVIIGVAAVIVLVSLVNGFSSDMSSSFESMGTNLIQVSVFGRGGNTVVRPAALMDFGEERRDVLAGVSPSVTVNGVTAKVGNNNLTTTVYGGSESFHHIRNFEVERGGFFNYIQVEARRKVCVLGSYTAATLFPLENPIGQDIRLNGNKYTVVGVLAAKDGGEESSADDMIVAPYTAVTPLSQQGGVSSYVFSAADKDSVDAAMAAIEDFLAGYFADSDSYRVFNQANLLENINELTGTLTLVLVGIAAISLLVGGIGIMNIMLVSVTERTKEIGVRKSLGAKRRDIRLQFLIEAATVSALGGLIGIAVGAGGSVLIGNMMELSAVVSPNAVLIAFSVSVAIGVVFGYFPAAAASKLNPIDALRYE
ncbi:MAG: ABC transporter permease [Gracilibacteraceae bacterium]|jgi:putative ABC transport system permease protein|nr:ABC transporter permease [Gracilibacteraceae bacterium]